MSFTFRVSVSSVRKPVIVAMDSIHAMDSIYTFNALALMTRYSLECYSIECYSIECMHSMDTVIFCFCFVFFSVTATDHTGRPIDECYG